METVRKCYRALSATQSWKVDALACFGFAMVGVNVACVVMLMTRG